MTDNIDNPMAFFNDIAARENGAEIFNHLTTVAGMRHPNARRFVMDAIRLDHGLIQPVVGVTVSLQRLAHSGSFFNRDAPNYDTEILCAPLPQNGCEEGASVTVAALVKNPGCPTVQAVRCEMAVPVLADKKAVANQIMTSARNNRVQRSQRIQA